MCFIAIPIHFVASTDGNNKPAATETHAAAAAAAAAATLSASARPPPVAAEAACRHFCPISAAEGHFPLVTVKYWIFSSFFLPNRVLCITYACGCETRFCVFSCVWLCYAAMCITYACGCVTRLCVLPMPVAVKRGCVYYACGYARSCACGCGCGCLYYLFPWFCEAV